MEKIKSRIKDYILNEVKVIWNPKNPHKKISFLNLSKKVDLLFWLLDFRIKEPYLDGVAETFYVNANKIIDSEPTFILKSTEQLAINFEKFVKKVGYLKYEDNKYWIGNNVSLGLKETSLQSIFNRILDKRNRKDQQERTIRLPEPLVQYFDMRRIILNIVTGDFITALYFDKSNTRKELLQYSNLVLGCYLMVIEDNFDCLYKYISPVSQYLREIINEQEYKTISAKYVELFCEKVIDPVNPEGQPRVLKHVSGFDDSIDNNILGNEPFVDTVNNLFLKESHFILSGDAGSGKTTTMQYFFYKYALDAFNNSTISNPIPIFIRAHGFRTEAPFLRIIQTGTQKEWVQEALKGGRIIFFIDGINEIDDDLKPVAYDELNSMMNYYPSCRFIISTRGYDFTLCSKIPSYKLQALRDYQIYDFIKRNVIKERDRIYQQILENENLLELAHNPLILQIIVTVSTRKNVPQNKGLLYDAFIKTLFSIEKDNHLQIDIQSKINILSQVALWLKTNKKISTPVEEFKELLKQNFDAQGILCDLEDFIDAIRNNLIIQINQQNVSFYHESYLDFLCAKAILKTFTEQGQIDPDFLYRRWYATLILCSDLTYSNGIAKEFTEFFFNGGVSRKLQKPLSAFTTVDFNEYILITCKIAYNLRSTNQDIYLAAEQYLNNTLILWLRYFLQNKIEPIPVELLFSAVAALNSERLITKLFSDDRWILLWLYDNRYEKHFRENEYAEDTLSLSSKFDCIIWEYSKNTPDFSLTYRLINQRLHLTETEVLTSVHRNLSTFRNCLLRNVPIRFLIKYFNEEPSYDILFNIIVKDFNYLYDNFETILTSEIIKGTQFFYTIVKSHPDRKKAYELVFNHLYLIEENVNDIDRIVCFSIYHYEASTSLMAYLDELLDRNSLLFNKLLVYIRKIAWDILSKKIQKYFQSTLQKGIEVKYTLDHIDSNSKKIFITVDRSYYPTIIKYSKEKIKINSDEYKIINILRHRKVTKCHFLSFTVPENSLLKQIKTKGQLHFFEDDKEFIFSYSSIEISKTGKHLKFILDKTIHNDSWEFPKMRTRDQLFYENIGLDFRGRSQKNVGDWSNDNILQISGIDPKEALPKKGEFEFIESGEKKFFDCSDYLVSVFKLKLLINTCV